ncbi:MAG: hypothetical protein J6Y37_07475 [Paludibacteraceae bacterium]|nr:hypothetical protein [Paludibacteraceae bacterium]
MTKQDKQQQIELLKQSIELFEARGLSTDDLRRQLAELENDDSAAPIDIYATMRKYPKYPYSKEMTDCIENTVNALLTDKSNANEPVLLLGKIQCGKTNTFENIMALAFDRGIDVCVVMTKGTRTLASQTINRMREDFARFKPDGTLTQKNVIQIYDVIENFKKNGLPERIANKSKVVIVCKKEKANLNHLCSLFEVKSPYLQQKKVLVIDDEADFASCNFIRRSNISSMAKISEQITYFRGIPSYCRYLQVTATPYALYLQPGEYLNLNSDGLVPYFKPRHTELVPVHSGYIGGNQYFEESEDPESMYFNLFVPVDPKCIEILGKQNKRYTNNGIASENLNSVVKTLMYYFVSAAVRSIQKEAQNLMCLTSCLIHVDTDKNSHEWQNKLCAKLIDDIKQGFLCGSFGDDSDTDQRVKTLFDIAYKDLKDSNQKAVRAGVKNISFPSEEDVYNRIVRIFHENDLTVKVINSDNEVTAQLNEQGQLRLDTTANIFIGGSILDRGITIDNMLCFFYGRDPKSFQMDTVLQHARMYGNRSKEDMAVTRFFTTNKIYNILKRINAMDEDMRQRLLELTSCDEEEIYKFTPEFIGYEKHIKPCANSKVRLSNVVMIKTHQRILPVGFQTGPKSSISKTINEIDTLIKSTKGFVANDFFAMDVAKAVEIIRKIRSTYIYEDTKICNYNKDLVWDENEMLAAIEYSLKGKAENKVMIHYAENREMSRIRENGKYIDSPDDGRTDTAPSRLAAEDYPVLMLLRQNGREENGWRGTPFYWPVLVVPKNINNVLYALNGANFEEKEEIRVEDLGVYPGMDENSVLRLTLSTPCLFGMIFGYKDCEEREIKKSNASTFLLRDVNSPYEYKLRSDISINKENLYAGIESPNDGVFPFELRKYKYVIFRNSHDKSGSLLLVRLMDGEDYAKISYNPYMETDVIVDRQNNTIPYKQESLCQWNIIYNIAEVVAFKLNKRDSDFYEESKKNGLYGIDPLNEKDLVKMESKRK